METAALRLNPCARRDSFNIIAVLMRSMTLGAVNNSMRLQQHAPADLYMILPVEKINTLDFDDIGAISKLGYESSAAEIRKWWSVNREEIFKQTDSTDHR